MSPSDSVRRDEVLALETSEGYPIYLHNVGGKEPDGKPTRLGKWTFATKMVRDVVLDHVQGRVLNACAGETKLEKRGCEFVRNDIDEEIDADSHHDVRTLHQHYKPESFDAVILDPPFDPGRAAKLYEGWHGQEYASARDAVGELVRPGGTVVELGWNSWSLSDKDGWEPVEHHLYRQASFKGDVHLTVDRRVNQQRLVADGGHPSDSDEQQALRLLTEHYQLDDCPKCELREEFGLVLGDADCAIGVAVCPHCGQHSRLLTVDPAGVATEHPYKGMIRVAWRWVPDWHPGHENVTSDWKCACGEVWETQAEARLHSYQHHPDRTRLTAVDHDRYPWRNVGLGEEGVMSDVE